MKEEVKKKIYINGEMESTFVLEELFWNMNQLEYSVVTVEEELEKSIFFKHANGFILLDMPNITYRVSIDLEWQKRKNEISKMLEKNEWNGTLEKGIKIILNEGLIEDRLNCSIMYYLLTIRIRFMDRISN